MIYLIITFCWRQICIALLSFFFLLEDVKTEEKEEKEEKPNEEDASNKAESKDGKTCVPILQSFTRAEYQESDPWEGKTWLLMPCSKTPDDDEFDIQYKNIWYVCNLFES